MELSSPTPARWPTGSLPWQSPPSHAAGEDAGEEGGRKGASSAAALIGSRPLDVLIALAWGCRQGPVAIASVVGGGGRTGGDFFFSVGEGREGGTIPSYLPLLAPTARVCRCGEHVQGHELRRWYPVTIAPDLGSGELGCDGGLTDRKISDVTFRSRWR